MVLIPVLRSREQGGTGPPPLQPPLTLEYLYLFGNGPNGSTDSDYGGQVVRNYGTAGTSFNLQLGASGSPGSDDPAWVTVGGVRCLEFAGGQFARPVANPTFDPAGLTIWILGQNISGGAMFQCIVGANNSIVLGLRRLNTTNNTSIHLGTERWSGLTLDASWTVLGFVSRHPDAAAASKNGAYTTLAGSAGDASVNRLTVGAGGNLEAYFVGRIAAVAVRAAAVTNPSDHSAMNTYLRQAKGVA